MIKQDATFNTHEKYTTDELFSIFVEEAKLICNGPDEIHSIAEIALKDFTLNHPGYVRFVKGNTLNKLSKLIDASRPFHRKGKIQ
jgi:hypothetical protein